MGCKRFFHLLIGIILLVSIATANAQTADNLIPNDPSSNQYITKNGRNLYSSNLEAGNWTVIASCDSFWDMQFRIQVSFNSTMSDVIAEGEGAGDENVSAEFTLDTAELVYIQLEEIGGNSGYYEIGVYDEQHTGDPTTTTNGGPMVPTEIDLPFSNILIIPIGAAIIALVIIGLFAYQMKRLTPSLEEVFKLQAPDRALPEKYRSEPKTSDIRTVRLPLKCPSCGASLSKDNISWTGPLEAECRYCGSIIHARLEKL